MKKEATDVSSIGLEDYMRKTTIVGIGTLVLIAGFGGMWAERQWCARREQALLSLLEKKREDVRRLQEQLVLYGVVDGIAVKGKPAVALALVDAQLDALGGDRPLASRGSFSDYLVPLLQDARRDGATAGEVVARVDRVLTLARERKFFSSHLEELVRKHGYRSLEQEFAGYRKLVAEADQFPPQ